jgi:hypothetical protein
MVTSRNGQLESWRRKVIQYTPFADAIDDKGMISSHCMSVSSLCCPLSFLFIAGHGTHVIGSLTGDDDSSLFSLMNGVASKSKISFYDIGLSVDHMLKLPPFEEMFQTAYDAGARIHSNSWGSFGGIYSMMSYEVDSYVYNHDDLLVVYAAGNNGKLGLHSVATPGNAKNVLTIGKN